MRSVTKKILAALLLLTGVMQVSCAQKENNKPDTMNDKKILVAFFSRADENYNVGYITEGNTQIVAGMIAQETRGELFHVEPAEPYPADYNSCIEVARRELSAGARPAVKGDIPVEEYDIVFLGYPNWWGDLPMALYTFIEKHDWQGKIVIPFCTHEGSGLGGTTRRLAKACKGASVREGLAVQGTVAQKQRKRTAEIVLDWLKKSGF